MTVRRHVSCKKSGKVYYRKTMAFQVAFLPGMLERIAEVMRTREQNRMDVIKDALRAYIKEFEAKKNQT
jgi:metal-responsive CopG/Arc/MetJ family transcriptional regulator